MGDAADGARRRCRDCADVRGVRPVGQAVEDRQPACVGDSRSPCSGSCWHAGSRATRSAGSCSCLARPSSSVLPPACIPVLAYHVDGHDLPLSRVAVVLAPEWVLLQVVLPLPILLFPNGRIASRRWRWTLWMYLAIAALWIGTLCVLGSAALRQHPVRIDSAGQSAQLDGTPHGVAAGIQDVVIVIYIALVLSWVLRLLVSYRGSAGDLRQQLKWLMSGGALCVVGLLSGALLNGIGSALFSLILAFPVCIGIAILKYRLYDIDRLISRALCYLLVTGLLIGVYVGLVTLATRALPLSSPVGVAGSTLAVAALFNPVRRRAQRIIDRRFNRAHYDADAIIAAFTVALRNEIDLESVQSDLVEVVTRSVPPAHVTVWIRSST